jgi:signal transduction histidine kinase
MAPDEKELLDLIASQAELVGSITHDLKGLISGVEGGIYLVNSGLQKDKQDRVDQGVAMMKRSLGRIQRTVAESLYYVKDREINWQPVEINALCEDVKKTLLDLAAFHGVTLEAKTMPGRFEADPPAVRSVISNLAEYAVEACQIAKLKPGPKVIISGSVDNEYATLEITADGFVMDEESRALALGPTYAPKGVDRSHLPVFMANRLISRHAGELTISCSRQNETTCLKARFPIKQSTTDSGQGDRQTAEMLAAEWGED